MPLAHITIAGVPYCQCEHERFFGKRRPDGIGPLTYPTNCGHRNVESALEGAQACRVFLTCLEDPAAAEVVVVVGKCGDNPWWKTPEGKAAQDAENYGNEY
jgi:hypothetical protein